MKDNSNYEIIENDAELEKLCTDSVELINYARNIVVKHVNIVQIMTYYSLGRWIVETQQMGEKRAKYGSKVIKTLSENLQKEFGKGFSEDTLKNARKFYLTYKERISETVFSLFAIEKSETVFSFFEKEPPFIVSWSHYLQLMRIENEAERSFYEIETAKTGWGVRTLQRQYNSSLYERLALSRDKEGVFLCNFFYCEIGYCAETACNRHIYTKFYSTFYNFKFINTIIQGFQCYFCCTRQLTTFFYPI